MTGEELRKLRMAMTKTIPISCTELAKELKVTRQTVYSWESGKITIPPSMAEFISMVAEKHGIPESEWRRDDDATN